jgi:arginase
MTEIRLLAVPYEVGALRMGVGRGPERLLEAGAEEALGSRGARVRWISLSSRSTTGRQAARARPGVTGMDERSPGVVWFDAHGDFNTPESTVDGYFDGMPLAILTGGAWRTMVSVREIWTVPESAVVLAGARDLDPLEELRLDSSAVHHLPPAAIDSDQAVDEAVDAIEPEATGLYVHVDLDVLDSEEARVNIYSVPGGLSGEQLTTQVRSLLDGRPVRAVSLTAYDPECDAEGQVPPIAMRLLEIVAEHVALLPG